MTNTESRPESCLRSVVRRLRARGTGAARPLPPGDDTGSLPPPDGGGRVPHGHLARRGEAAGILCIGHSHLACVAKAADDAGFPLQALNFWEMPGAVEKADGRPRLCAALQERLRGHAGPVFSLIGGGAHGVLGTLVHPRRFDFVLPREPGLPLDPQAELLPALAVRRVLESMLEEYLALMAQVRELCGGPVFHVEPPPPSRDGERMRADMVWEMFPGMRHEISPPALRYKLWRLHSEIVAEWCAGAGVRFVPCPPAALDASGFLLDACYGDGAHANLAYGGKVLAQIRALA